ncbi:MAG: glycosyltransferase family 39 protein [Cyanobacteria bacterium SZAS-4]|nr:glycosyltransferase family 39 protein [Cyanobacteria bacterium SZAS-4]
MWTNKQAPLLLFVVCLALYFFRLGNFGILEGGESYYPAACREMVQAQEWIVPQLNYQIYFSKPIMTFWLINSAYVLFGVNELAGRLWSSALCTMLVYFCYFTTRALAGARAGLLAGLILASSPLMVATCRRSSIDAYFSCFFGMALCAMIMILFAGRKRWWPIVWAGLALAVLTKGPAAIVLFVGGLIGYFILQKSDIKQISKCLKQLRIVPGLLIFLAMIVPWCAAVSQATNGLFLKVFLLYENLSRFTGNTNSGKHPHWWTYLPALVYGAFPWSLFLPAAMVDAFTLVREKYFRKASQPADRAETTASAVAASSDEPIQKQHAGVMVFSLAYVLVTVVFFSLSRTQFDRYILPIWCPLVIMIALSIEKWIISSQSISSQSISSQSISSQSNSGEPKSAIGKTEKFVSPILAGVGCISFIGSIVAAFIVKDAQTWMRFAATLGVLVLAVGWVWQFIAYRKNEFAKSTMILAISTCLGFAIATPVLFEYWYDTTYAGVHELVKSVADTDADVGQYKEFMPSLLYYRKGPVFFFYHLSQLLPRKAPVNNQAPPTVPPVSRPASDPPTDHRTFILVKKDFEPELLAQPQLNLKLNSRRGDWSMYETSDFVMDKPPTLEESFNRLNWKDSMTDKFGFGPLTVPYSGGHKLWIR